MTIEHFITYLLGGQLPQYDFADVQVNENDKEIVLFLKRREAEPYICSVCGQGSLFCYDTLKERCVEDLPFGENRVYLKFAERRIVCPYCGKIHIEKLPGITPKSRQTDRFRLRLARECEDASVSAVARRYGLNDETVRRIDKEFLAKREQISIMPICRRLGIDEIALKKGHFYATVFYDHDQKNVLHMIEGRKREDVEKFFKSMGKEWCESVEEVTSDLWRAYKSAVKKYLPNAVIITDKFHVFKYCADALDEHRRSEYARQQDHAEFDLKKYRFLIQKAGSKLSNNGKKRLEQLKEANEDVYAGYLLKEQIYTFYAHESYDDASAYFIEWTNACIASGFNAFVKLGKRLKRHAESILMYFKHRISNAFAEGINNKIKVVKRMAFGFHDFEYFRLKILAATGFLKPLVLQ